MVESFVGWIWQNAPLDKRQQVVKSKVGFYEYSLHAKVFNMAHARLIRIRPVS